MEFSNKARKYTISESYDILYKGLRTIRYLSKAKRESLIGDAFIERIMLAVTEVNGCAICSYAHAKMALKKGMDKEEIQYLLSGNLERIPKEELSAIMFAQHYAETKGHPSLETWNRILEIYGKDLALGILAATRMIMLGNTFGIPLGSFKNRMKGKPDTYSTLTYELSLLLLFLPFSIISIPHILLASLMKSPIISF